LVPNSSSRMFLSPTHSVTLNLCNNEYTVTPFKIFISCLMVITGSINTLSVSGADYMEATNSAGEYVEFNHPFFQANVMMMGEMLCMVAYLLYWACGGLKDDEGAKPSIFLFLPPAIFDVIATCMMYTGLTMTPPSQFQILRGAIMIFVALLSRILLKRKLEIVRWAGIGVVVAGIVMVGGADFMKTGPENKIDMSAVTGDIIIVAAQLVAACQFVYEEKYITKYNLHPLKVVGMEGIFGFTILVILQVISFNWVPGDIFGFTVGNNPRHTLEDSIDAFTQLYNEPRIIGILSLTMLSIALFNFSGVSITKYMSATTRKVLDTLRTIVIWACNMGFHQIEPKWKSPTPIQLTLQLPGFFLVAVGILLYSDVLIMPYIRNRREKKKQQQV